MIDISPRRITSALALLAGLASSAKAAELPAATPASPESHNFHRILAEDDPLLTREYFHFQFEKRYLDGRLVPATSDSLLVDSAAVQWVVDRVWPSADKEPRVWLTASIDASLDLLGRRGVNFVSVNGACSVEYPRTSPYIWHTFRNEFGAFCADDLNLYIIDFENPSGARGHFAVTAFDLSNGNERWRTVLKANYPARYCMHEFENSAGSFITPELGGILVMFEVGFIPDREAGSGWFSLLDPADGRLLLQGGIKLRNHAFPCD